MENVEGLVARVEKLEREVRELREILKGESAAIDRLAKDSYSLLLDEVRPVPAPAASMVPSRDEMIEFMRADEERTKRRREALAVEIAELSERKGGETPS
jgi:predicted RNase H-like nuclease (RuvC/YqgF family)